MIVGAVVVAVNRDFLGGVMPCIEVRCLSRVYFLEKSALHTGQVRLDAGGGCDCFAGEGVYLVLGCGSAWYIESFLFVISV